MPEETKKENTTESTDDEKAKSVEVEKEDAKKEKKVVRKVKTKKKKIKGQITSGRAYIQATYNNTLITLTDQNGNALFTSSAGQVGFKGPKKSTPYAASMIVRNAVERVEPYGLREVHVFVKGVGSGRESAIRALNANGINVLSIKDMTPIPHNGCRPKRPRRV